MSTIPFLVVALILKWLLIFPSTAQMFWKKELPFWAKFLKLIVTYQHVLVSKIVETLLFGDTLFNQFNNNRIFNAPIALIISSKRLDLHSFLLWLRCKEMGSRQNEYRVLNSYFNFSPLDFILFTYSYWFSVVLTFSQVLQI